MRYHIITVGSELTLGLSVNTNAPDIARRLGEEGFSCTAQVSVPDERALIAGVIKDSLADVDIVIITGGLGPTSDDITREALCDALGLQLEFKPELETLIRERFGERGHNLPQVTFRQAYLPSGATPIPPTLGSAPGIIIERGGKFIFALPGVPWEMAEMLEQNVAPLLKKHFKAQEYHIARVLKTTAASEGTLQEAINHIIDGSPDVTVGIIASPGEIQLQLVASGPDREIAEATVSQIEIRFRDILGEQIFGLDDETMESVVGELLREDNLTIAVAESCTGGLVAKRLTNVPGSSAYFLGGVVSYSNDSKTELLGVPEELVREHGAVSEQVALFMAEGIRAKLGANIGVSVTGIAGPDGATSEKPVGLVFIGLSNMGITSSRRYVFYGSRDIIRRKSANMALDLVRRHILKSRRHNGGD